jgi:hypothetical protein
MLHCDGKAVDVTIFFEATRLIPKAKRESKASDMELHRAFRPSQFRQVMAPHGKNNGRILLGGRIPPLVIDTKTTSVELASAQECTVHEWYWSRPWYQSELGFWMVGCCAVELHEALDKPYERKRLEGNSSCRVSVSM